MSDKPDIPSPVRSPTRRLVDDASAHAAFLYFDEAATFGYLNGVVQVTLEANRLVSREEGVTVERIIVSHLRMSIPAARSLKAAIEGALLLAEPASSESRN